MAYDFEAEATQYRSEYLDAFHGLAFFTLDARVTSGVLSTIHDEIARFEQERGSMHPTTYAVCKDGLEAHLSAAEEEMSDNEKFLQEYNDQLPFSEASHAKHVKEHLDEYIAWGQRLMVKEATDTKRYN